MINAIAGLVLGYLFFQLVNSNRSGNTTDNTTDDITDDTTDESPVSTITNYTLTIVYFEGINYLYHLEMNGEDRGYVIGNSTATSFNTQNISTGAITFEYNGSTYSNVIQYTYQSGVDWIDAQTNTQPDPTDPIQPQPQPDEEEDDGGFDYAKPDFDYGLDQNSGQFSDYFTM